jgi:hypothetical protein
LEDVLMAKRKAKRELINTGTRQTVRSPWNRREVQ